MFNERFPMIDRNSEIDPDDAIAEAEYITLALCSDPGCGCVHVLLVDKDQQPIAQALFSPEIIDRMHQLVRQTVN